MKAVRNWSVRNAGWLKKCYALLEGILALFNPLLKAIGHERLDKPFSILEGAVKGFLFDSQSCGQCTLGETGMACPMNCPKTLRNGPCGGARQNRARHPHPAPTRRMYMNERHYLTAMWMPSMPPTAPAPTATCRVWGSARC